MKPGDTTSPEQSIVSSPSRFFASADDARADGFDLSVDDENVRDLVERLRRIDDATAAQQESTAAHRPPPPFADSASSGLPPESR